MKPMKPMEAMKPMPPMEPMKPMVPLDNSWWPAGLSDPSSSGQQGGMRYAFFPAQKRLAVERDGRLMQYDTGEHHITGVSQAGGTATREASFTSQNGEVELSALKRVD
jgi:hypothetical protein